MNINEEITALRTMSIDPIGYLVAPRMLSILIMTPALVVFAYLVGMLGGALVAGSVYGIGPQLYIDKTFAYLGLADLLGGLLKAGVFGFLIGLVGCYFGLNTNGGPTGLGRNIMVSVVTSLVIIVFADATLTGLLVNYVRG
jgi:phospholipid/cholesterol/gamma-HCH transport system permease protein